MKKILLSIAAVSFSFGLSAQFYTEDFEGVTVPALPSGWSQVTVATDGGYKTSTDMTSAYFDFPAHTQYVGTNDDDCNCDKANEELISNSIVLSSGSYVLSFEYILGQYYGETAEVGISTDGGSTNTQLIVLSPTNTGGAHVWTNASFDISSYAGQTINIVWTYHDNNDWGSGLMVDDIVISQPAAVDMEMTALTVAPTVAAGATSITGTVTSNSANNITSIDVSWNDGSGANSETFSVNMNYGDTYDFTHGTPLNTTGGQTYNVDVTVTAAGDADASNDMLSTSISAVSSVVPRVVVGEEKTGEWCGWCPRGGVALAEMAISNPDDFIGIAVHNGDPMTDATYDEGMGTLIGGYPSAIVDRGADVDPSGMTADFLERLQTDPAAVLLNGATWDPVTRVLEVSVKTTFSQNASNSYKVACALTEDGVTGTDGGYNQSNAYAGGGNGVMGGYEALPNPVPAAQMVYDHVARSIAPSFAGSSNSFPASINAGEDYISNFSFTLPADWDENNMHIIGMLMDPSGRIDNGSSTSISTAVDNGYELGPNLGTGEAFDFNIDDALQIYPNPAQH